MVIATTMMVMARARCLGGKGFFFSASHAARGLEEFLPQEVPDPEKPVPVYGRAWKAAELRNKSFTDLHALWFILCKEKNALSTEKYIYQQQQQPTRNVYNAALKDKNKPMPARHRFKNVRLGMARIKTVLTERAMKVEDVGIRRKLLRAVNSM